MLLKRLAAMLSILPALAFAHTDSLKPMIAVLTIPFQNVTLNPNQTIQANYTFGSEPIIFCYENNLQSVGRVTWPYKGHFYSSTLSITLITNGHYQGEYADASGRITILNNLTTPLIVSCEFAM